ncbi:crossover junction endonuclease MUS81 isoform X2 [Brienomyrus brachyistius]|nr:crossover junction endonuclease MUS81 isoform X2 [Brienomyrus brachyistius]XP_048885533.1 crossover junction endonuclease MUS81 isoform X2 [Brienomyrus brachyistius]
MASSAIPSETSRKSTGKKGCRAPKRLMGDGGIEKGGRKRREYVPQKRSGGYAVLLALYRHCQIPGSKGYLSKLELQREAQTLCDASFTAPSLGSKYTAWSSVSTLLQRDLLLKTHNPARYSLTEVGMALAQRLESSEKEEEEQQTSGDQEDASLGPAATIDLTEDEQEEKDACTTHRPEPLVTVPQKQSVEVGMSISGKPQAAGLDMRAADILLPGSYDIVLCVDFIETTGGCAARKQELVRELQRNGVTFDIRKLNVGDFLWVAKEKVTPVPGHLRPPPARELVLDYVIERKRIDDLCGSIIDGRFREQKFRLKRCGLRRPVYLVEECGSAGTHLSLPESTLQQAVVNTQVVDGFFVKRVQDVRESAVYLTIMTRYLQKLYRNKTLVCRSKEEEEGASERVCLGKERGLEDPSCSLLSFAEFNEGAVKNKCQTVREVFARQLMQISGVSGDKAAAILEHYGTVSSLLQAYEQCSSDADREKLLSSVRYGKLKRNIGPALSRTIYQLYSAPGALS